MLVALRVCACAALLDSGLFVVPTAGSDGLCSDSSYLRYLTGSTRSCLRSTSSLASSCAAGGTFSGSRYVSNIKVGKIRTANPTLTTQYVAANISAVYLVDAATGAVSFLASQSYGSATTTGNTTSSSSLGSFTFPEPSWNGSTCRCENVLLSVDYLLTHEAGGQVSSVPAPNVVAYVTSIAGQ